MRGKLIPLLLFAAPFVGYALYLRFGPKTPEARRTPLLALLASGVALALIAVFVAVRSQGGERTDAYEPARYIDGEIVPGRIE